MFEAELLFIIDVLGRLLFLNKAAVLCLLATI
jgi:hypothetical protein